MSIYMKVDGIDGNVTAKGLEKYIELEQFHSSIKRMMSTRPGVTTDREGAKPSISEITVTKKIDATTPKFFQQATVGTAINEVLIKFINTGASLNEYYTLTLSNVMISSQTIEDVVAPVVKEGDEAVKDKPVSTLTLNFDKIEVKYTPFDKENQAGSPIVASYDVATAGGA